MTSSDTAMFEVSSVFVSLGDATALHLRRFTPQGVSDPPSVFMLHGAIENGRVFYSHSGKGLAPFLAAAGFEVFVVDLRGRGKSRPPIGPGDRHGQTLHITEDIPACLDFIEAERGRPASFWVAHSWGGVLLNAVLARYPRHGAGLLGQVFFGSKRCVRVRNWTRFVYIDLVWMRLCPLLGRIYGYVPARRWRFGSDNETVQSHRDSVAWVKPSPWRDTMDGFDYGQAIRQCALPPTLYIAGANDKALGHADDVRDFMRESGQDNASFVLLSRANGNRRDYGHLDMLTAPEAATDHFPLVRDWMRGRMADSG